MSIQLKYTHRGFVRADFKDANGVECSIQESSAADQSLLWLGCNDPNAMQFPGNNTGWHPYKLPENVQCTTRMHLSREQVTELLPLLQQFVETGELAVQP